MARTVAVKPTPTVVLKTRSAARGDLERFTRAIVGKPPREAFLLLDSGKLRGTLAEVHLRALRELTA
jgi:hypothetical protein